MHDVPELGWAGTVRVQIILLWAQGKQDARARQDRALGFWPPGLAFQKLFVLRLALKNLAHCQLEQDFAVAATIFDLILLQAWNFIGVVHIKLFADTNFELFGVS